MTVTRRESWRESKGQAMVEFALIAMLLMWIFFGIIEGGRIFSSWLIITNEAREAARYGSVGVGDPARQPTLIADVKDRVSQRTTGILDQSQLSSIATMGPDPNYPQWLKVQINYNVEILAAPLLIWFPKFVPLTAVSTMRTEDAAVGGG
ncbi:MAG: pilus assembly protein [Dehalococcoidia bacterium]|nr:pilus assembly protein [Dehalococcoidia bacterium]